MGRGAHHPAVSSWAQGSQNAATCQQARQRALDSLRLLCRMQENIVIQPQGIRVFHQCLWGKFSISMWIHQLGWLTRTGPSNLDQGCLVDDQTLGLAPLVGMEVYWGPSLQSGLSVLKWSTVEGVGVIYHLMGSPLHRKRVMPVGNVGSPPSSLSRMNWTCFLGLCLAGVGALHHCSLLLNLKVLGCSFKSLIWRQIHPLE